MTRFKAAFLVMLVLSLIPLAGFFPLGGVTPDPKHQRVSFAGIWSGQYQAWFETHFSRHFGAFRALIKLDSAIDQLIGESKFNTGLCGLRGKNDVVIPVDEIDFRNRVDFDEAAIDARVEHFAHAAEKLKRLGVTFRVFFMPNKLTYFPKSVSKRWFIDRPGAPGASEAIVARTFEKLRARGVPMIDVRDLVARVVSETGAPAFPNGGRHFTDFTSCQMLGALQPEPVRCPAGPKRTVRGAEDDLRRCLNETTWWAKEKVVDTDLTALPSPYKKVLFVGSSYMRELENEARRLGTFDDLHLFYYNKNDYVGEAVRPLPTGDVWKDFVRSRDLIVIDFVASQVENLGHGFVDQVDELFGPPDFLATSASNAPSGARRKVR